jgi:hypothetical protein
MIMGLSKILRLALLLILFVTTPLNIFASDDISDIFEYRFPHADPIRIYSGTVRFTHKNHISQYRIACVQCHHYLELGDERVQTSCRECHTEEGFPRFEDAEDLSAEERIQHYLVALHDQCIDCHIGVQKNNRKSSVPISCTRCHLRN